jgi:hypothetical protein
MKNLSVSEGTLSFAPLAVVSVLYLTAYFWLSYINWHPLEMYRFCLNPFVIPCRPILGIFSLQSLNMLDSKLSRMELFWASRIAWTFWTNALLRTSKGCDVKHNLLASIQLASTRYSQHKQSLRRLLLSYPYSQEYWSLLHPPWAFESQKYNPSIDSQYVQHCLLSPHITKVEPPIENFSLLYLHADTAFSVE